MSNILLLSGRCALMSAPAWSDLHDLALVYHALLYSALDEEERSGRKKARERLRTDRLVGDEVSLTSTEGQERLGQASRLRKPQSPGPLSENALRRLVQLYPEVHDARWHQVFQEAFLMYVSVASTPMLDVAVASLGSALPRTRRLAVLNDLTGLASEGKEVPSPSGLSFIQYLAVRWDLTSVPERSG